MTTQQLNQTISKTAIQATVKPSRPLTEMEQQQLDNYLSKQLYLQEVKDYGY